MLTKLFDLGGEILTRTGHLDRKEWLALFGIVVVLGLFYGILMGPAVTLAEPTLHQSGKNRRQASGCRILLTRAGSQAFAARRTLRPVPGELLQIGNPIVRRMG